MKYYIIAGEASGDLHASNLMKELKLFDPNAKFRFWGGDLMQQQGGTLVKHYRELAYMGVVEVIKNLRTINKNFKFCEKDLLEFKPDVLILVDYPGFNLRIAKYSHKKQIKTYYYISPKIWAWKKSRAYKIKKYIDKMFTIFPFEKAFYKNYKYEVEYFGNPLVDEVEAKKPFLSDISVFLERNKLENKPIIALLAGSRKMEIKIMIPDMLTLTGHFPDYQFVIAGAPSFNDDVYKPIIGKSNVKLVFGQTYDLLKHATAAVVTSGTATLETALLNIPQVVVYKMHKLTYDIGHHFVKPKFFSLVNIIIDREIVKEFLQIDLPNRMKSELNRILNNNEYRQQMLNNYKEMQQILGGPGASKRTAEQIVKDLRVVSEF
jgi:lipid-A-disaccharide synthase